MGGAIALKALLKEPRQWDGVVLVAPMCKVILSLARLTNFLYYRHLQAPLSQFVEHIYCELNQCIYHPFFSPKSSECLDFSSSN